MVRTTLTALIVLVLTTASFGAIVNTVFDKNTATGFETAGAAVIQAWIDGNGAVPSSPSSFEIGDVIDPSAVFLVIFIERQSNEETNPITLDGVSYEIDSSDAGNVFDVSGNYSGVDPDGSLIRAFTDGNDGVRWTSDDVELSSGTDVADYIGIYSVGFTLDDTTANRSYLEGEVPFEITGSATSKGGLGNGQTFLATVQ